MKYFYNSSFESTIVPSRFFFFLAFEHRMIFVIMREYDLTNKPQTLEALKNFNLYLSFQDICINSNCSSLCFYREEKDYIDVPFAFTSLKNLTLSIDIIIFLNYKKVSFLSHFFSILNIYIVT